MNLNQVTIPSTDVSKAIDFYTRLGLKLIVHTPNHYARFECPRGDATFSIHYVDQLSEGNGIMVYFEVDNVQQTVAELQHKNIHFDLPPTEQTWLWTEARLMDPDGNQLVIYYAGEHRKNPPWRLNTPIND